MRYELMIPEQIRAAIRGNLPACMAVGVIEYHAEHLSVGVDGLLVVRALEALEREMGDRMVLFPPYYYGSASYAAAAPENNGTLHVDSDAVHAFARQFFKAVLRVGFRNVHVFVHHQTENFAAGMPTDLALKLGARQAAFEIVEKAGGDGWWGDEKMATYYSEHAEGGNPLNAISVHPLMDEAAQREFPIDHAGKQETSLMMALAPDGVRMDRFTADRWFAREAKDADPAYGAAAREKILAGMRRVLGG